MIWWISWFVSTTALVLGIVFGVFYHALVFVFMLVVRKRSIDAPASQ
jgi:hypothetical protein